MRDVVPSDLVVMRTPLLPFEELEAWNADLQDRAALRARLLALIERPDIAEALFLASPDLLESVEVWKREPESKKGRRVEHALVRYFLRMATRPTPFGLFSGCTAGRVGERTQLSLAGRDSYRRHSRLDMDYLFALCESLARDPQLRSELRYRPNSSLYENAGRLRFAESRVRGSLRTYHLVAVDAFDALRETLQRASEGARLSDLAASLVDDEITLEDAESFVLELVENQLLVPDLALPVTGEATTAGLLRQLGELRAGGVRDPIARAEQMLEALDRGGVGSPPEVYRGIARELEPLGIPAEVSRLFQVDLMKPASELVVGGSVIAEVLRGVDVLQRVSGMRLDASLDEFRRAFVERYGTEREVPLLAALDEESGVGFERSSSAAAEASPLLAELPLSRRADRVSLTFGTEHAVLLHLLTRAIAQGDHEIALTDDLLKRLENPDPLQMPEAFQAMFTVAAAGSDAIERGDYRVVMHGALGPSGARMLGRFCHLDDAIREGVEKHIAAEEALHPDTVFAELVHLPEGRLGNILARPVLRDYEIAFLARSGVPSERQIPLDDLFVSVSGDRIRLRSKRLDREVIPRLTSAHNTNRESLGVYRFLSALQRAVMLIWSWGPLDVAPYLPRVTYGRVVLWRARWRIGGPDIRPLAAASGAERDRLARELRAKHRMPRYVVLKEGDHELLVDFENAIALDAVIDLVRNRDEILLTELLPAPDQLCAEGPEGRFVHELIVPFTQRAAPPAPPDRHASAPALLIPRTFVVGSEWLFAKLYTGTATADRVLLEEVAPLAAEAIAGGAADRWFFIRYSDPEWHLRVRFHGHADVLRERVQPALEEMSRRLLAAGAVWKVQLDTYEREVERYGGPEAIELAEEIFHCDSDAVVAMLESCSGDAGSDLRWQLMLAGMDRLYADFGIGLAQRLALAERSRDGFSRQYAFTQLRDRLADRFRRDRRALDRLLDGDPAVPALARRSERIAPLVRELLARRLRAPVETIVPSILHMFVNRLSRSAGPEHELVLYDYLVQLYRSRMAREGKRERARAVVG